MTTQTERMREALGAASNYIDALGGDSRSYRQALTQPEQPAPQGEAAMWAVEVDGKLHGHFCAVSQAGAEGLRDSLRNQIAPCDLKPMRVLPLYTTPPQAEQAEVVKPLKVTWPITEEEKQFHEQHSGAVKPNTLSEFIRSDDSTRAAIGARVVDAAVEMQREVVVKPETERAEFVATTMNGKQHDTGRVETKYGGFFASTANPEDARRIADALNAALLSADSKAAGEPVLFGVKYDGGWTDETFTSEDDAKREHGWDDRSVIVALYARPQAAELAALKADMTQQVTEIEALRKDAEQWTYWMI